jgi:hypothetical protein
MIALDITAMATSHRREPSCASAESVIRELFQIVNNSWQFRPYDL